MHQIKQKLPKPELTSNIFNQSHHFLSGRHVKEIAGIITLSVERSNNKKETLYLKLCSNIVFSLNLKICVFGHAAN